MPPDSSYGYPRLTAHGAARIAQRFGCETEADALLWALRTMARARFAHSELRRDRPTYTIWHAGDVRVVTDDDGWIITAYSVGDEGMGAAG